MKAFRFGVLLLLLSSLSCASHGDAAMYGRLSADQRHVVHVVMMWLKEPGNVSARDKIIQTSYGFRDLPGVISVQAGPPAVIHGLTTRPIDDTTFDVGVVMEFKDENALLDYLANPQHEVAVRDVLRPLTQRVLAYTFVNGSVLPAQSK